MSTDAASAAPAPRARPAGARVAVLGVRHHGPGSARAVQEALDELDPARVLVEGPPELGPLVAHVADAGMVPPVAGLVYVPDSPRLASFYPMAEFSPEWVALRWAVAHGRPVDLIDLPAAHALALDRVETEAGGDLEQGDAPDQDDLDAGPAQDVPGDRGDPLARLAAMAGYDDPERWWEDVVEHRGGGALARFESIRAAMAAVRDSDAPEGEVDLTTRRREAAMRTALRRALRATDGAVAVVCGAFHAPALHPDARVPVASDRALLTGLPKVKVTATWAPWTAGRLASTSGYGAGVTSPGWYQHLFRTGQTPGATAQDATAGWLVRVARTLRAERLDVPPASVVEATRLAEALAALRGRPSAGLPEVTDAARAVLLDGADAPLALVERALVVGEAMGAVPDGVPQVPLAADLARRQRSARLTVSPVAKTVQLDLRQESGRDRSVLLHSLRLIGVDWGVPVAATSTGTFREAWELVWAPELAVRVVEAGLRGSTVPEAAATTVRERAEATDDLAELALLVEECLRCRLPDALGTVLGALEQRAAVQHDPPALLRTIEPLARTRRYGDVREVPTDQVAEVLRTVVARLSVALRPAAGSLDDAAASALRQALESADRGVRLLADPALTAPWERGLVALAADDRAHPEVSGRVHRLLLDTGTIDSDVVAERMSRRLSAAADPAAGVAWLEGFLEGDVVLLLHDARLLALLDDWVAGVDDRVFEDLLPLLRRAFARFSGAERRQVAHRLRHPAALSGATTAADDARALPAVHAVARLIGLEVPA